MRLCFLSMLLLLIWGELTIFFKLWRGLALHSAAEQLQPHGCCSWFGLCWFIVQSLQYLSGDEGSSPPPQPSVTGWWGAFAREFTACVGISGSPCEKWSLCQVCLLPHWSRTSLLQGEGPSLHAKHLISLWQTQHRPNPHSNSDWISVLVKENIGGFF